MNDHAVAEEVGRGVDTVSPVVRTTCRITAKFVFIFALYVVFHGHYSPGGGFQGGALLAASVVLLRMSEGFGGSARILPYHWTLPLGALGVLVFLGLGLLDLVGGGSFLQYEFSPFPGASASAMHYWGILLVEIGIGLAVMAILVGIFDTLITFRHG